MSTVIIDYGMGNVASVQKALKFLNVECTISNDPQVIKQATALILPGVGAFTQGMHNLHESGLIPILNEEVMERKKPFLGICLGMQLLASVGHESGECAGLGWIKGTVQKMENPTLRIPHIGWNTISLHKPSEIITQDHVDCYFTHSFHFEVEDPSVLLATVDYGSTYVAAIEQDNLFAAQFHPEKSQQVGLAMLGNFFKKYA